MKNTILFFALFLAPVFASAQSYITYIQTGNEKIPMMRVPSEQVKSPAAVHVVALQNELEHYHSSYLKGERIKQKSDVNPKTLMTLINVKEAGWKLDFYKAELAFYSDYDKELAQKERGKSQMAFIRKRSEEH